MKKRATWRTWLGRVLVAIPALFIITILLVLIYFVPGIQILALIILLLSMFIGGGHLLGWRDF